MCEREEVSSWQEDSQQLKDLGTSWCFLGTPWGFAIGRRSCLREQGLWRL